MKTIPSLTLDDADNAMRAALDEARQRGLAVTIAVVDAAGQMLQLSRMTGARAFSIDLASRKARTAASTGFSTAELAVALKGQPLAGEVLALAGGLPVRVGPEVAGAIGVSGGSADEDEAIGAAGLAALPG